MAGRPRVWVSSVLAAALVGGAAALAISAGRAGVTSPDSLLNPRASRRAVFAFTVNRSGYGEIYTMNATGGGRRRLTAPAPASSDAAGSREPVWSPDGARIAFVSTGSARREDERDNELYVMRADGSGKRRLTTNNVPDWMPSWSPDGRSIAFVRAERWGKSDAETSIWLASVDGSGASELRRERAPIFLAHPSWSPDGRQIAFSRSVFVDDRVDVSLWVMDAAGHDAKQLAGQAAEPDWSPDGTSIAFSSDRDRNGRCIFHDCSGYATEIYVMDADGARQRRLTSNKAYDVEPDWSPDGRSLVFARIGNGDDDYELHVVRIGGGTARLTRNAVWDLDPAWRPRG